MSVFAWVMALWTAAAIVVGLALGAAIRRNTKRSRAVRALPPVPQHQPGADMDHAGLRRLRTALTRKEN